MRKFQAVMCSVTAGSLSAFHIFSPCDSYQYVPRSRRAAGKANFGLRQHTRSAPRHTARGQPICLKEPLHDRFVPLHPTRHQAMEQEKRRQARQHPLIHCRGHVRQGAARGAHLSHLFSLAPNGVRETVMLEVLVA